MVRRIWRHQRINQNPQIKGQTTHWPNENRTKTISKTLHRKLRSSNWNPTKNRGWTQVLMKVSSSCSTSDTIRVTLATHPVIHQEWGKNWKILATKGTYPWSFVKHIP